MAKKKKEEVEEEDNAGEEEKPRRRTAKKKRSGAKLHPDAKKTVWIIVLIGIAIVLVLAAARQAGPMGTWLYAALHQLFGIGYYLLPTVALLFAFSFVSDEERDLFGVTLIGGLLFILSGLGMIDIIAPGQSGLTGTLVGTLENPFGKPGSLAILFTAAFASFVVTLNKPLHLGSIIEALRRPRAPKKKEPKDRIEIKLPAGTPEPAGAKKRENSEKEEDEEEPAIIMPNLGKPKEAKAVQSHASDADYVFPPPSLLVSSVEKPTIGDLRANANIIKRTLESFGIPVEMGEINVGPTVTRYTLKPAEGVKVTRITALGQDLALALAAHPIRIEAPIPGKSLVGIEVPNKAAAIVRLGSLILYPDFQTSGLLSFALGRDVNGDPSFPSIEKMPHLLVAGATGSGKSIMMHAVLLSLLFKNSPASLRLILVDPKRVELTAYNDIPHLLSPVITDNKKSIGALRWAIQEMDRRYQVLMEAGSRDIKSYNSKHPEEKMPAIIIVIDELADLMASFGREVEGAIIRLAQMARATGIHLILSTQRPSVEVITGLIKANIPSRIALQVASQIDSRTILDMAGAEKLLGRGDLLFTTAELSKPKRMQGSFISEEEIKKVVSFIKKNNAHYGVESGTPAASAMESLAKHGAEATNGIGEMNFDETGGDGDDDALYEEALETVRSAKKASASLLQRRLRIGYARAARLLDLMEERGVIGPGEGAKPRDVLVE